MNENNFNKSYDTSTTGISVNSIGNCLYKLPCGYCKILEKPCPVSYTNGFIYNDKICDPPYNLNQVTCKMEEN